MIRHSRRRAPALADLAHARRQAAADRPAIAAVGHGDERIVPDPEWDSCNCRTCDGPDCAACPACKPTYVRPARDEEGER